MFNVSECVCVLLFDINRSTCFIFMTRIVNMIYSLGNNYASVDECHNLFQWILENTKQMHFTREVEGWPSYQIQHHFWCTVEIDIHVFPRWRQCHRTTKFADASAAKCAKNGVTVCNDYVRRRRMSSYYFNIVVCVKDFTRTIENIVSSENVCRKQSGVELVLLCNKVLSARQVWIVKVNIPTCWNFPT